MAPRYRRVAVVGAGPFGLAAVHALAAERVFDTIRVFDRRPVLGPRQQRRCRSHAVLRTRPFPVANSPTSIARFQAQPVVVALGHYHVPLLPDIPGLMATARQFPGRFEHAKSYGKADNACWLSAAMCRRPTWCRTCTGLCPAQRRGPPDLPVHRYYCGRNVRPLPSPADQPAVGAAAAARRGGRATASTQSGPDFAPYYDWLINFAGPPAVGSDAYALPW